MATYDNPTGISPLLPLSGVPGIILPEDFNLEAADRSMVAGPVAPKPKKTTFIQPSPVKFPSRNPEDYGVGISRLIGAFSGPGFNLIFRPHSDQTLDKTPESKLTVPSGGLLVDLLELNLTHEVWTFPRADLGAIPNRVAAAGKAAGDAILTVDRLGKPSEKDQDLVSDIHFEPGLFIHVPHSSPVLKEATMSRMASIPHGTTINAQGSKAVTLDGKPDIPPFSKTASQPFSIRNTGLVFDLAAPFKDDQFNLDKKDATRLPQNMKPFLDKQSAESITERMVQDPNELLRVHNEGKNFGGFVKFTLSTTPSQALDKQACPHLAARTAMNAMDVLQKQVPASAESAVKAAKTAIAAAIGLCTEPVSDPAQKDNTAATAPAIGSSNIAFLDGTLDQGPNSRTGKVTSTFWISTVSYTVKVDKDFEPQLVDGKIAKDKDGMVLHFMQPLEPEEKSSLAKDTVPSFVFPADKPVKAGRYRVTGTQIQYSQTVNLIFNGLVWPHISVATIIPVRPVVVNFATKLAN